MRVHLIVLAILALAGAPSSAFGEEDLTELSIEELLTIEVTSVARKRQRVEDAAAAVFVISSEDIRRSGATRITDLFRMVPGVQVGENDTNAVAVSARGFNERFASKLLILVDGRAIYRSVLSSVFWDQVLVPLQEIERIEVVRGPGAALWGAGAVNGVINIITKHPIDTQGGNAVVRVGTNELGGVYGRWGGLLDDDGAYRFYVRGDVREGLVDESGDPINENARTLQGGFRVDWEPTTQDAVTFQGDIQRGDFESVADLSGLELPGLPDATTTEDFYGINGLGRWTRTGTEYGDFSLQAFADYLKRGEFGTDFNSAIFGVDFQQTLPALGRHELIWGLNLQFTLDQADGEFVGFDPASDFNQLYGVFLQDEIELIPNELSLTLGSRLEYNSYVGFDVQPSARVFWRPAPNFAVWGAASRATRTPARFEQDLASVLPTIEAGNPLNPLPLPVTVGLLGGDDLESEELYSLEFGTRFKLSDRFAADLATYVNFYDDLILLDLEDPVFGSTGVTQFATFRSAGRARSFGAELTVDWEVTDWWRFLGAYSYQNIDLQDSASQLDSSGRIEGLTPMHQGSLRAQFDVTDEVEFDLWLKAQTGLAESDVPGFVDIDARLSWRPRPDLELSLIGRNLLQAQRPDFNQSTYPSPLGQVERSVIGVVEFRF